MQRRARSLVDKAMSTKINHPGTNMPTASASSAMAGAPEYPADTLHKLFYVERLLYKIVAART